MLIQPLLLLLQLLLCCSQLYLQPLAVLEHRFTPATPLAVIKDLLPALQTTGVLYGPVFSWSGG